jgi:hypothetical protein
LATYPGICRPLFAISLSFSISAAALAAVPGDTLMSAYTRGFASTPDLLTLEAHWEQTQMGQLIKDEAMQPFVDDLKRQLERKLTGVHQKLGLTYTDLRDVAAGEIAFGLVEQKNAPAAVAVTVDVTGRQDAAKTLLTKIDAELSKRRAKRSEANAGGVSLVIYNIPPQGEKDIAREAVFFLHQDMLCASDSRAEAEGMLKRFGANSGRLADLKAYQETMSRCAAEAGSLAPEIRWFLDPWGYARAARTMVRDEPNRGKDYVAILESQGFDAIVGMGGFVNLAVDGQFEILHRSSVYAPPVAGAADKYRLAMRMMEFPNGEDLAPQPWIPRKLASYRTFNCDLQNAYQHFGSLFDAIAGVEDAFAEAIKALEVDPYGPHLKVGPEFIAHLGQRVSLVTDYELPITTKSERYLFAVELTNEAAVAATIEKLMLADPNAHRREFEGKTVWEILPPTDDLAEFELGLEPIGAPEESAPAAGGLGGGGAISNSAVCVTDGHLYMASHLTFLQQVIGKQAPGAESLGEAGDFDEVQAAMNKIIAGPAAVRCFRRSDEAYRPTYELLRQGKMPESETLLGRVLNRLLTPPEDEEEGILRKQKIDGRQLPNFEMVRRYFSPAGTVVRSLEDGWFVAGATLTKHPAQATAGAQPVREASRLR